MSSADQASDTTTPVLPDKAQQRLRVRRIYDQPATGDGQRVLIDGMWPRGVRKADAELDDWRREVAPSQELRRWFGHDPARFEEFARCYREELRDASRTGAVDELAGWARTGRVTLLTATRDVTHSHARVLRDELRRRLTGGEETAPDASSS